MPRSGREAFSISLVEIPLFYMTCKSNFEISISCMYKHLSRKHDTSQDKLSIKKHLHLQLFCIKTREIINEYLKCLLGLMTFVRNQTLIQNSMNAFHQGRLFCLHSAKASQVKFNKLPTRFSLTFQS